MKQQTEILTLRRITKYTCRISVPPDYLRNHGLQPGDRVQWIPQTDGRVLLEFNPAQVATESAQVQRDTEAA